MSSYTVGLFNWHSREAIIADMDALKAQRGPMVQRLPQSSLAGHRCRREPVAICPRAGPAGVPGELRAVPWQRRRRRQGISESARRRMALGRRASKISRSRSVMASAPPQSKQRQGSMPAFGRDGILKRPDIEAVDGVCALARGAWARRRRGPGPRQEGLCRDLRHLSWRRRQGQARDRSAESDRRNLALWFRPRHRSSMGFGTVAAA